MLRKIIKINEEKSNGCGLCAEACHEDAIGMVNGKAKLLRDDYCDGLGDCLPVCPTDAISFEEREAAAYNEEEVKRNMEQKKNKKIPYLVMSGGQGEDEPRAEAEAMKEFAIKKGYDPEYILTECKSRNTSENLAFSKKLMDRHSNGAKYKFIISSNNYHTPRAILKAKKLGMNVSAIGAVTANYYLQNALLREYIAVISMGRKKFLITVIVIFSLCFVMYGGLSIIADISRSLTAART